MYFTRPCTLQCRALHKAAAIYFTKPSTSQCLALHNAMYFTMRLPCTSQCHAFHNVKHFTMSGTSQCHALHNAMHFTMLCIIIIQILIKHCSLTRIKLYQCYSFHKAVAMHFIMPSLHKMAAMHFTRWLPCTSHSQIRTDAWF